MRGDGRYPAIADYALIGDCHSAALVSRAGSIDWCCMPRFDSGSVFGRLLDWDRGGDCSVTPTGADVQTTRRYLDGTLILETTFASDAAEARLIDCFTMRQGGASHPYGQILRVLEGVRGRMAFDLRVNPRFDYGEVRPWIRGHRHGIHSAIGGNDALVVAGDVPFRPGDDHDLVGRVEVRPGHRSRLSIHYAKPETLETDPERLTASELDRRLEEAVEWWQRWSSKASLVGPNGPGAIRSAIVLKALCNASTGAIVAAPTTSLPETPGGERNWDYRYSWIRDSVFAVRSLSELGCRTEADGFRRFVERSAAGSASDLRVMYGPGGERRLTEVELTHLHGYRGARPVRVGNGAAGQIQLDCYGHLLELAWRWHELGHSPDDDYWRFVVDLVETAARRWAEPDHGIWETRGRPQHFVHSKAMCWVALDRGIRLAEATGRPVPQRRWRSVRRQIRDAILERGYDGRKGTFVRAFDRKSVDGSLLLLPSLGFVEYDDERMVRTVDAVRRELQVGGLFVRYRARDGLPGTEGAFLVVSFWLAECLARQGRRGEAREAFDAACATANDVGLFAEEYDAQTKTMLGNFPQGLTHLSHIAAACAISQAAGDVSPRSG
jgi:GH15 family glucan-1,4-alpha-glucosidase